MTMAAVEDETFVARLASYIGERLGVRGAVRLDGLQRIAVGWSHETWLFDAVWETANGTKHTQPLCVRRDPGNALLRDKSDLAVQFRVLQCLETTDVPSPSPYWFEDDEDLLGGAFLVMERVEGVCPSPWGSAGRRFYAAAAERGVLPTSFTMALAAIHKVDWAAAGLSFLGVPAAGSAFATREIDKWDQLIASSGLEPDPILVDLVCWLRANAPESSDVVLNHGAYRTGNVLIAEDDRVAAVLDWELQVLGDPMFDVAYLLSELNRDTDLLSNVVRRDEFFATYEEATGIAIDEARCDYYQMLYMMRSVAFWMSAAGLYEAGASDDLRLARAAWSIAPILDRAAKALGY